MISNPYDHTLDCANELLALREESIAASREGAGASTLVIGDAFSAYTGLAHLRDLCHGLAVRSGWWTNLETGEPVDPDATFAEKIALIHSEASEALEGHRKALKDSHLPHRSSEEVELADLLIRVFDLAGAKRMDLAGAVIEKLAYNQQRVDHKLENRRADHGKRY